MRNLLLTSTLAALVVGAAPTFAAEIGSGSHIAGVQALAGLGDDDGIFERRGRGRGGDDDRSGGGDDDRDDDNHGGGGHGGDDDDDENGGDDDGTPDQGGGNDDDDRADDDRNDDGHGGRPRIPGGSGCDDPGDVIEHPECRV